MSTEKYKDKTDEEIILALKDDEDSAAVDYIMNKYKNLVRKKAGSMFILGADREDLIQEGMIGLFKAIRDYDYGRDASFATFADLCVSRQMYSAIQASARKKQSNRSCAPSQVSDCGMTPASPISQVRDRTRD